MERAPAEATALAARIAEAEPTTNAGISVRLIDEAHARGANYFQSSLRRPLQLLFAMSFAMAISYRGLILPQSPVSGTAPKCARNAEIRARHSNGESISTLAEKFGITEQPIWQILNDRRK